MRAFVGVNQKPNGCWMACLASLTGIPLDEFPDVPDDVQGRESSLHNAVTVLLREHGWQLHRLWTTDTAPRGWAISAGESPRGLFHAVVVHDGALVWDPHPSRAGLKRMEDYEVLIPMRAGNELPASPR